MSSTKCSAKLSKQPAAFQPTSFSAAYCQITYCGGRMINCSAHRRHADIYMIYNRWNMQLIRRILSNLWHKEFHIPKLKCPSSRLAVVFAQSTKARCQVENEDAVGAAPIGHAQTTSEWSTISLPPKARFDVAHICWLAELKHEKQRGLWRC